MTATTNVLLAQPTNPHRLQALAAPAFVAGVIACGLPFVTPGVALAAGLALAMTLGNPFHGGSQKLAKQLLQACVVLLGFGMDLPALARAGVGGFGIAAASIVATLVVGAWLGRQLRVPATARLLISAGTAICGGSAIAAVGTAVGAGEADLTIAMGTVFLLNAAALYAFPPIGHALHLSQEQFGTWAGIAIHDVSSVVGAAHAYGASALQVATAVKLSRALWIAPLMVGIAWRRRGQDRVVVTNAQFAFEPTVTRKPAVQLPWFIGLFVLASIVRSVFPVVAAAAPTITHAATIGLTVTLFLIGSTIRRKTLAAVGWRPLVQGLLLWLFISTASLAVVLAMR